MLDWQTIVSLMIVAMAALYLIKKWCSVDAGRSNGCGQCPASSHSQSAPKTVELYELAGDTSNKRNQDQLNS